jgi:hypothetical protein
VGHEALSRYPLTLVIDERSTSRRRHPALCAPGRASPADNSFSAIASAPARRMATRLADVVEYRGKLKGARTTSPGRVPQIARSRTRRRFPTTCASPLSRRSDKSKGRSASSLSAADPTAGHHRHAALNLVDDGALQRDPARGHVATAGDAPGPRRRPSRTSLQRGLRGCGRRMGLCPRARAP